MLPLQSLDRRQITAVIISRQRSVLFGNPSDSFVDVAVETLHFMGAEETLFASCCQFVQTMPSLIQFLKSGRMKIIKSKEYGNKAYITSTFDDFHVRMSLSDQLIGCSIDFRDTVLLIVQVLKTQRLDANPISKQQTNNSRYLQEFVEFPLEYLHVFQVLTEFFGRNKSFLVPDPIHQLVALARELQQFQSFLKTIAFFGQLAQQLIPQAMQFVQTPLKRSKHWIFAQCAKKA